APNLPAVAGDPNQLQQVFLNLFTNAIDAMPRGGEIRVQARAEGDPPRMVCCEVSDTGMGIEPELLPHVFDAFITSKAPGEGTGLGLAVARDTVTRHGGTLSVQSTPGQGGSFTLRLPLYED